MATLRTAGPYEGHEFEEFVLNHTFNLRLNGVDFKDTNRLALLDYYSGFDRFPFGVADPEAPGVWRTPCGRYPIEPNGYRDDEPEILGWVAPSPRTPRRAGWKAAGIVCEKAVSAPNTLASTLLQ